MVEKSFFYWLIISFLDKLSHFFKHSRLAAFAGYFSKIWTVSGMHHILFVSSGLQKGFAGGIFGRFFESVSNLGISSSRFFADALAKSRIISGTISFCDNLLHISLRSYGVMLFLSGSIPSAVSFIENGYFPLLLAALSAFGFPLMFLNRSIAQIYNGSWMLKKALGFFFVEELTQKERRHYLPLFIISGLAFGGLAAAVDLTVFILVFGGIVGGMLIFYKTEFGIFASALLIPIMPTMMVLGLFSATVLSFAAKVFITGKIRLKFASIDVFALLFGAIVAFSMVVSFNRPASAPVAAVYLLYVLFYFAVRNTVDTKQKLFSILSVISVSGLFVSLYGIWQRITGNFVVTEAWLDTEFFDPTMVRIYSTLENPNVLGGFLIFIIMIAFGMIYYFKDYLYKAAAAGILGAAGLCMVFTQSRGAWLGLIFAMGIFALLRDKRLVILGIIAVFLAPFVIPPEVLMRFLSIGDLTDTSTSYRVFIWLGSLDLIRVFWPIGIGLGNDTFVFIYNLFAYSAVHTPHSHNLFLQIIIDLGIAGLVTFFLIIGLFVKRLFAAISKKSAANMAARTVSVILASAVLGYMLMGMTDNVWYNYRVLAFFWMILALGAALANGIIGGGKNEQAQI